MAIYGFPYLVDNIETIATIIIVSLIAFVSLAVLIAIFSERILTKVFGTAKTDLVSLGEPLNSLFWGVATTDKQTVVKSSDALIRIILARISWFEVRRWMLGVIIGLAAAFAGIAGSVLLYKQNELLTQQNIKIDKQNDQIDKQNQLLSDQIVLTKTVAEQSEAQSKQMYTFDFVGQSTNEVSYEAIRATIGLRQLRDLYEATNYDFFIGTRQANVKLMYAIRNWYYSQHSSSLLTYLERIDSCMSSKICQPDVTLLFVCPYVHQIIVPNEKWLTFDKKREPFADPLFRLNNAKVVKRLSERCPPSPDRKIAFTRDLDLFRSSASYGEAKRLIENFEKSMNTKLPTNKAESRDLNRLKSYSVEKSQN